MKVSFIIPVYKVEQYLDECVQSILTQTYKDYEVLLVDDGSPDNCPTKCDEWAGIDSRVKALHKPNGGLSDARNYGLIHATGDYVVFMDSDDYWRKRDNLETLITRLQSHPNMDFVGFNCSYYYPGTNTYSDWVAYDDSLAEPVSSSLSIFHLVKSGTVPMSACMKIIKRSLLVDNNIFFKKGIYNEDIPWFLNLLRYSKECCFINEYIYAYRQNVTGSITSTKRIKYETDLLNIIEEERSDKQMSCFTNEGKRSILSFLAFELCTIMGDIRYFEKKDRGFLRERVLRNIDLLKYTLSPKVKSANIVYTIFGYKILEYLLGAYMSLRDRRK